MSRHDMACRVSESVPLRFWVHCDWTNLEKYMLTVVMIPPDGFAVE